VEVPNGVRLRRHRHRYRARFNSRKWNTPIGRHAPGSRREPSATFINVGDIPLTASATKTAERNTGALAKDESKAVTFAEPGAYFYICTPNPRMYGQVIVD
jgi:hypothetical protein